MKALVVVFCSFLMAGFFAGEHVFSDSSDVNDRHPAAATELVLYRYVKEVPCPSVEAAAHLAKKYKVATKTFPGHQNYCEGKTENAYTNVIKFLSQLEVYIALTKRSPLEGAEYVGEFLNNLDKNIARLNSSIVNQTTDGTTFLATNNKGLITTNGDNFTGSVSKLVQTLIHELYHSSTADRAGHETCTTQGSANYNQAGSCDSLFTNKKRAGAYSASVYALLQFHKLWTKQGGDVTEASFILAEMESILMDAFNIHDSFLFNYHDLIVGINDKNEVGYVDPYSLTFKSFHSLKFLGGKSSNPVVEDSPLDGYYADKVPLKIFPTNRGVLLGFSNLIGQFGVSDSQGLFATVSPGSHPYSYFENNNLRYTWAADLALRPMGFDNGGYFVDENNKFESDFGVKGLPQPTSSVAKIFQMYDYLYYVDTKGTPFYFAIGEAGFRPFMKEVSGADVSPEYAYGALKVTRPSGEMIIRSVDFPPRDSYIQVRSAKMYREGRNLRAILDVKGDIHVYVHGQNTPKVIKGLRLKDVAIVTLLSRLKEQILEPEIVDRSLTFVLPADSTSTELYTTSSFEPGVPVDTFKLVKPVRSITTLISDSIVPGFDVIFEDGSRVPYRHYGLVER